MVKKMIKIIKQGIIPKQYKTIYTITCKDCGCIFEAEESDFNREVVGHGECDDTCICPTCFRKLYLSGWGCSYETKKVEV